MVGTYPIPSYLKVQEDFIKTANHLPPKVSKLYHARFLSRIEKYEKRGLHPQWIDFKEKCEWIKRRVVYIDTLLRS